MAPSTLTHHFRVLREAGVIRQREDGNKRWSALRTEDLEARFPGILDAIMTAYEQDSPVRTALARTARGTKAWPDMRLRLTAGPAFWVMATAYLSLMLAASAPSPLYVVYQQRWHFSAIKLTTIFGVYVLVLLAALLTVGGLSDYVGRKPVMLVSFTLLVASMIVFARASGVGWLYAARILQGLAAGSSLGAVSAAIIDFAGPRRMPLAGLMNSLIPSLGLALGALVAGGIAITLLSLIGPWDAVFYAGSALTGLGAGATLGAIMRALSVLPAPAERGEFFAAVYAVGYLAFSVPAVIAGVFVVHAGLIPTTIGYGIGVSLLALMAITNAVRPGDREAGGPAPLPVAAGRPGQEQA